MPVLVAPPSRKLNPPPDVASNEDVTAGKLRYHTYCGTCHGDSAVSTGVLPDLRYSAYISDPDTFVRIVREGSLQPRGMVGFGAELSARDVELIREYVIRRAHESATAEAPAVAE
jgi:alcohol dehydrogenase (cytochrome c)/quinohemoprotein ethanol dehydrogenase